MQRPHAVPGSGGGSNIASCNLFAQDPEQQNCDGTSEKRARQTIGSIAADKLMNLL